MKKFFIMVVVLMALALFVACEEEQTHEHLYGEWGIEKEATCVEDGQEVRLCDCGEKDTRTITKKEHTFGEWVVEKEPTCVLKGENVRVCVNCGKREQNEIDQVEHTWNEATCVTAKTCVTCGATQGEPDLSKHEFVNGSCTLCRKTPHSILGEYVRKFGKYYYDSTDSYYLVSKITDGVTTGIIAYESGKISICSLYSDNDSSMFLRIDMDKKVSNAYAFDYQFNGEGATSLISGTFDPEDFTKSYQKTIFTITDCTKGLSAQMKQAMLDAVRVMIVPAVNGLTQYCNDNKLGMRSSAFGYN